MRGGYGHDRRQRLRGVAGRELHHVGADAEQELYCEQRRKPQGGPDEPRLARVSSEHADQNPEYSRGHNRGPDHVRYDPEAVVPEGRPQHQLQENRRRRARREPPQRKRSSVLDPRLVPSPVVSRKERQAHGNREKQLSEASVADRNRRRQVEQHRDSPQRRLSDNRQYCDSAQPPHPLSLIGLPEPHRQQYGQQADRSGDHPVPVLILDASDHARHAEAAERSRPVGNGQAGIVRGDQSAGDNQKESRKRDEGRVTRQPPVRSCAQFHGWSWERGRLAASPRACPERSEGAGSSAPTTVALSSLRSKPCAAGGARQVQAADDRRSERSGSISPASFGGVDASHSFNSRSSIGSSAESRPLASLNLFRPRTARTAMPPTIRTGGIIKIRIPLRRAWRAPPFAAAAAR